MKKIILLSLLFLLTSCFWSDNNEIEEAKNEIFSAWNTSIDDSTGIDLLNQTGSETEDYVEENKKDSYVSIEENIENNFIEIDSLWEVNTSTTKVEIKWMVNNKEIDKIIVNFSNSNSSFPNDSYTLTEYKKWDDTFLYRAFKEYQVLDKGLNEYVIDGYIWSEKAASVKVEIFIWEEEETQDNSNEENTQNTSTQNNSEDSVNKNIWGENDNLFLSLPIDENTYGKPVMLWTHEFTYSQVNWLEISLDEEVFNVSCDNIDDYLSSHNSWYYWNTCRPIRWDNWVFVNVLSLEWENNYVYNRVYLDKKHWLLGEITLESWEWVTKDNIWDKNNEFKDKEYDILEKTDKLFSDLLK